MSPFNQRQYDRFRRNRTAGGALMATGLTMIVTAIGLAIGGALGEDELIFAAIAVEVTGNSLFFPGLGLAIQGKRGMAKAKAGFYKDPKRLSLKRAMPATFLDRHHVKFGYGLGTTLSF